MVRIYINGIDAKSRYGITLASGGFSALRKPAPLKPFVESKSRLQHGKRIVVKNPKYEERTLTLPIILTAKDISEFTEKYDMFCSEILDTGMLNITVDTIPNVTYRCIYEDCQQYTEFVQEMAKFILKLVEPNPKNRGAESNE